MSKLPASTVYMLRAITKSAVIILALDCLHRSSGARELAGLLGIHEVTVSRYLREMEELGLVERRGHKNAYVLSETRLGLAARALGAAGLPGAAEELGAEEGVEATTLNAEGQDAAQEPETEILLRAQESGSSESQGAVGGEATSKISRLGVITTTESPHELESSQESEEEDSVVAVARQETRKKRRNLPETSQAAAQRCALQPEVVEALREAGIGEPKRSELARLDYISPRYVRAWEQQLRKDRGEKYCAGLLVHVLLTGDDAPPCWPNGHLKECTCMECGRFKYRFCPTVENTRALVRKRSSPVNWGLSVNAQNKLRRWFKLRAFQQPERLPVRRAHTPCGNAGLYGQFMNCPYQPALVSRF